MIAFDRSVALVEVDAERRGAGLRHIFDRVDAVAGEDPFDPILTADHTKADAWLDDRRITMAFERIVDLLDRLVPESRRRDRLREIGGDDDGRLRATLLDGELQLLDDEL